MIALTQRLWVTAVQTDDQKLHFADYEIYMLRLHRLILPEFDFAQSQELISEDWMRDSNGSDYLDYGFFHSSMFELVGEASYQSSECDYPTLADPVVCRVSDLWTDTVEPEDVSRHHFIVIPAADLSMLWHSIYPCSIASCTV